MLEEEVKPGHNSEYSSFYGKLVVIFFLKMRVKFLTVEDMLIPRSKTLKHRNQICHPSNETDMIETKA